MAKLEATTAPESIRLPTWSREKQGGDSGQPRLVRGAGVPKCKVVPMEASAAGTTTTSSVLADFQSQVVSLGLMTS
eukprot:scaffold21466_cov34-Prasinocladus_malaysianus.AAC.1